MPANVQYAWPHSSQRFLYVTTSDSAPGMGAPGNTHHVTAIGINPVTGALSPHGTPVRLPARPIHVSTDGPSRFILVAFNNPSAVRVYRIEADATPGEEVVPTELIDPGIFAHQVRVTPDNRQVILVTRGHNAAGGKLEEPGALKVFDFKDGVLANEISVAPNGGYGFGPRHLDFHPSRPWVYVSLERQNELAMFRLKNGTLSSGPIFCETALSRPATGRQAVGAVHVHPRGHTVYVANRASDTVEFNGHRVFAGGENSLAVFAIDSATGEPTLIQHVESHGIHPRTFHIDPSGRLMAVGHIMGLAVRNRGSIDFMPARLSLFRIASDGRLEFVSALDLDVGQRTMWWMGMIERVV
jgi:6-phosphogluconolactonase (cycloisomerase 2 family)